jgi:hypothetical protein
VDDHFAGDVAHGEEADDGDDYIQQACESAGVPSGSLLGMEQKET